jgi:surface antigen
MRAVLHRVLAIPRSRGRAALCAALSLALAACVGPGAPGPKTQLGAATGAAAGGLLGAALGDETEGILAGVLLGGLVGGAIGNALDDADREYAMRTSYYALERTPSGTTSSWHNPDTGHSGGLTPLRTWETADGGFCREFQQTVRVGGRSERAYGTACRQPDGSWRIVQ